MKSSLVVLSLHTSCANQQGAQKSLHLFLFSNIQDFPSMETSKQSERSLKSLAPFFWGPEWQNYLRGRSLTSALSSYSLFLWQSQSSLTIIRASKLPALQSRLAATDKSFDLCIQSLRWLYGFSSSLGKVNWSLFFLHGWVAAWELCDVIILPKGGRFGWRNPIAFPCCSFLCWFFPVLSRKLVTKPTLMRQNIRGAGHLIRLRMAYIYTLLV